MKTVKDVIAELSKLPQDLPVFFASTGSRWDEYHSVKAIEVGHLKNQNTDGDPEFYWADPANMDEEEIAEFGGNKVNELVLIRS